MRIFALDLIFILKERYSKLKLYLLQKKADFLIKVLASIPKEDENMFAVLYEMALAFDEKCVDKGIYLD